MKQDKRKAAVWQPGGKMTNNWLTNWKEDLDQLAMELPRRHKNLFFACEHKNFEQQIEKLKSGLEQYDNFMIAVNIAKIIASVKDAHTALMLPAMRFIPFEFYWFEEGIFIIGSLAGYAEFLHSKVTHINGMGIDEVIRRISEIVPRENSSFLKGQLPKYLSSAEALYGLEIIDDFNRVELTVESLDGKGLRVMTDTCPSFGFHRSMTGPDISAGSCVPLYRQNKDQSFWSHFLEADSTMYFNYNSCKDRKDISVRDFGTDLMEFISQNNVQKLIVDLRNNLGGDSALLEPFIEKLSENRKLNTRGGIFVILGRDTFSSALLNAYALKSKTAAIFIGEATGGKPNCYGEVEYLRLRNSGLKIRFSTVYYKVIEDDKQLSFYPEIECIVTFADYLGNRDACAECALAFDKE